MPVTPTQKQQVYEMLGMLGVKDTGDLKGDLQNGLGELEKLINETDADIKADWLGEIAIGSEIDQMNLSDDYTKADGQAVIKGANQLADVLDFLVKKQPEETAERLGRRDALPQSYKDNPQLLINKLREMDKVVTILDKAAAEGWVVEGQTVENTSQNPSNTTEQKSVEAKFDIEAYKAKIGDASPEGQLAENFGELQYAHLDRTLKNAQSVAKYLGIEKDLPPAPDVNSPDFGKQSEEYLIGFMKAEDKITAGIEQKYDDVSWTSTAWTWIKNAASSTIVPRIELGEKDIVKIQEGTAKKTLLDIKEAVAAADALAAEQNAVVNGQEVVNGSVVQNGLENQNPGTELSDIEQASMDVETVLKDVIAPMLAQNGVQITLSGEPDGTFDEASQKALQSFLIAADMKLGDLGDKPWLYTEELGGKLGENLKTYIKNDPVLMAQILNDQLATSPDDPVLGVKDGVLVYAKDDVATGRKKDQPLSATDKETLAAGVDDSIDGFILNLNILNGQNAEKKKVLSDEQLVDQMAMMPPQMKLIGFLIGMLAPYIPESWMNGINSFCKEMFGFDLKSMIPQNAETGDFSIGKAFGVTGDKAVDNDKLTQLYKEALADAKGDVGALRSRVTAGIKSMFVDGKDPAAEKIYMEAADKAFEKSEKILSENPEDAKRATDVFVGEFYKGVNEAEKNREGDRIRKAGLVSYDDNDGYLMPKTEQDKGPEDIGKPIVYKEVEKWNPNGEEGRRDYLVRLRDEQRDLSKERYNLGIRPNFERGEDGRVYMEYYDRKVVNNIAYYEGTFRNGRQVQPGHIENLENAIKNYEEKVQAYERQIGHLQNDLKKDLGSYAKDKQAQIDEVNRKLQTYVKQNSGRVAHIREDIVKGKEELEALKGTQYKRVDVTDELARLDDIAAEGNWNGVYHTQFPGLSKAVQNYGGWGDMQKIHGLIEKSDFRKGVYKAAPLTKRQQSFEAAEAKSATKYYFNKASNFVDDWNDLEDERKALQEQHEKLEADGVAEDSKEYKSWARKWDKLERKLDKLEGTYKEKIQTNQRGVGLTDAEGKRVAFRVNKDAFMDPDKVMKDTDYGVTKPEAQPLQTQGQ